MLKGEVNMKRNVINWKPMLNRKILTQIELEDDDTPYGGIDKLAETAVDFCDSIHEELDSWESTGIVTLNALNEALKECGIKQLSLDDLIKKFGYSNILSTVLIAVDPYDNNMLEEVVFSQDSYLKIYRSAIKQGYFVSVPDDLSDQSLLNDLENFTLYDVDQLINAFTSMCFNDPKSLSTVSLYSDADVDVLDEGFENTTDGVTDVDANPVIRSCFHLQNNMEAYNCIKALAI